MEGDDVGLLCFWLSLPRDAVSSPFTFEHVYFVRKRDAVGSTTSSTTVIIWHRHTNLL
jgi:hypothetical protein